MPNSNYIKISIDGQQLDLDSTDVQVGISYQLEDDEDFQKKKSSEAFSVTVPATVNNDQIGNTLHNPSVDDLTAGQLFRGYRKGVIEANGHELLVGKAFLVSAKHTNRPTSYEYDFYGNNGDWMIDLKEATLFDFLKHVNFFFTESNVVNSWFDYDGSDEDLPYVFAPVRYRNTMEKDATGEVEDQVMAPTYLKPSLSVYWIIYWAFKSLGYRVQSNFMDTSYFRRLVMPWTWGNFLSGEGNRQDNLKFLAKGEERYFTPERFTGYADCDVTNTDPPGAYNNNGVYSYDASTFEMKWTYITAFEYGALDVTFNLQLFVYATASTNSDVELRAQWYKNGNLISGGDHTLVALDAPAIGSRDFEGIKEDIYTVYGVEEGDEVSVKLRVYCFESDLGIAALNIEVLGFQLTDIRIPIGGTIDFQNYNGLKNYKFLDFFKGIIDCFNIIPGTDSVNKVVLLEPAHPYSVTNDLSVLNTGYFNGDYLDWSHKQDLSQESTVELYRDYEREVIMKFKDDSNDGILKLVQDRNVATLAAGKYVFPERFKSEKKQIENRFFSPVMHYDVTQWKDVTAVTPQMVCIIPENISNTSNDESQNTFQPKLCYYKGYVAGYGGWRYLLDGAIQEFNSFPFMFAVNYHAGGENDPVLSFSDEKIGDQVGKGLLRRFFLQRFAIMSNGQYYTTSFRLNNLDATNWYHREHKICRGQRWELVKMTDYRPLSEQTTECYLRRWVPISQKDAASIYPTGTAVITGKPTTDNYDMKYAELKCLAGDIPGPITTPK